MLFSQQFLREDLSHKKSLSYIKVLYKIKNSIHITSFMLYIGFVFKSLGPVLLFHIFDQNDSFRLAQYLHKLTACYNVETTCINLMLTIILLCAYHYALLIIPYILFHIATRIENNKNPQKIRIQKKILLVTAVLNLIILFLSQHIIEVFSFILYAFIFKNEQTDIFINQIGITIFLVLNCFLIIYINVYTFYYVAILNAPFISQVHTIQIYQNKWFKVFMVLLFNSQAVSLLLIFSSDANKYSVYIIFVFLVVDLLNQ